MLKFIEESLREEKHRWVLWIPIGLSHGIGLYFLIPQHPSFIVLTPLILLFLFLSFTNIRSLSTARQFCGWALFWMIAGWGASSVSTWRHNTSMLNHEVGPLKIQGTLKQVELFDTETRFTLSDCIIMSKSPSHLTLNKIRVNWRGALKDMNAFVVGDKISVYAVLTPPKRPVFDGAYNFRRHAYFMGLSATGYCLGEPKMHPDPSKQPPSLARYRHNLTLKIREALPGETGGLVVALVTGDRSGISNATKDYFAKSGVAHILAISGLHLSLIAGIFFLTIRRFLSLIPMLALRLPLKKIAAIFAWIGTLIYLMICDFPIPAERAFIMISIFFLSILLDREAISLRSVALSATIILILKPEALLNASFQLSFSAVTALVAFYEGGRYGGLAKIVHYIENKPIKYVLGLIITSLIASLATTPYIAYFFHHITLQSLTGNLLAVPLLGFVIMPLILVFLISLPFGGSSILNLALTYAFDLLTHYLEWVSRLAGAAIPTGIIPWYALSLLTTSLLWLLLWHTRIRYGGILGICISSALIFTAPKPDLYIDPHRKLIAFYDSQSHQVIANSLQYARFARKVFMEASGTEKVIRIPSKPGLYRFGSLLFERQDNRLAINRTGDYMEVEFNDEKLSHIILNGKEIDLPDLVNQGILCYWLEGTLKLKPETPLHSTHPWE